MRCTIERRRNLISHARGKNTMRSTKHLRFFEDHLDNVLVIVGFGSLLGNITKNETVHTNPRRY